MDEESIGLFGVLLIVTAMVLSQSLQKPYAPPTLPQVNWEDVVSIFGCDKTDGDSCYLAMSQ